MTNARFAKSAIIKVGNGRGFVVEGLDERRFIITAACCLEGLLPITTSPPPDDHIYPSIIGPVAGNPILPARCTFIDPMANIAILEPASGIDTDLKKQCEEYLGNRLTLEIEDAPKELIALLPSLEGGWITCQATHYEDGFWIKEYAEFIRPEMCGSPILTTTWRAVGVVCLRYDVNRHQRQSGSGPHPRLVKSLPGWMLRQAGSIA